MNLETQIRETVHRLDHDGVIALTRELVRIPSVNLPGVAEIERPVADHLCRLLDEWGMAYRRWDVEPGRPNIVVDLEGIRPGPTLLLEGHMDVVTAGDPRRWSFDPFGGELRDGKILGRGSADMKAGLAGMLYAAKAIHDLGADFPGRIRLAMLCDEEGMMIGAKDFVARGYLDGVAGVISCEPEGGRVCVAQKGALRLQVDLYGKMAHGCMPEEGVNPIAVLGEIIRECAEIEREFSLLTGEHPYLGHFYFTPTVISAGVAEQTNVVTNHARLFIDVRTTPAVDHDLVLQVARERFERVVANVPGAEFEITVLDDRPSTETSPHDPVVVAVSDEHERIFGCRPPLGGVPGSTDATIFWAATRVPVAVYGPGDTTIPHQVDEFVRVDDVMNCARVYAGAALRFLHSAEVNQ